MKTRVTSIAESDLGQKIADFTWKMQQALSLALASMDFGATVGQLTIVYVAVDDAADVNQKFAAPHDQCSRYKDLGGNWIKQIGVAVLLSPANLKESIRNGSSLNEELKKALIRRLDQPINRIPKGFRGEEFLAHIQKVLNSAEI